MPRSRNKCAYSVRNPLKKSHGPDSNQQAAWGIWVAVIDNPDPSVLALQIGHRILTSDTDPKGTLGSKANAFTGNNVGERRSLLMLPMNCKRVASFEF